MKKSEKELFLLWKSEKNFKNMAMKLFLDSHGPIFRAKNEKNAKVKKITLVDFFKKSLVIFIKNGLYAWKHHVWSLWIQKRKVLASTGTNL